MLLLTLGRRNENGRKMSTLGSDTETVGKCSPSEGGRRTARQDRLGLWRGSVETGEAGAAEVVGEDAVKCAASGTHGGGSYLAQAHAVSPAGTVEDESGRN